MPIIKNKDEKFFKKWTPDMAYVLGFIFADGALTINPRGSKYIDIAITDRGLLYDIRKVLNSNHKIKTIMRRNSSNPLYRLQIGSKIMFGDLLKLGLLEKKTFRFKLPHIPNKFISHFVRGYFDGDGSIWCGFIHKERKTRTLSLQTVFTSGNKKFLEDLQQLLLLKYKIKGFIHPNLGAYRLVYSVKSSLLLYDLMYNKAINLYLNRKKIIFEKYMTNAAVA